MGGKELVCQVLMVDPVRVGVFAVRIRLCALRKDLPLFHIGIVERIEVHCQTVGMERKLMASTAGSGDLSEIKAGRIICLHGRQIIAAEIIH